MHIFFHFIDSLVVAIKSRDFLTFAMSLSQSYALASKVRSKLTKDAQDPKSSLRSLVVQANMLDSLLDHISEESKNRAAKSKVSFREEPTVHRETPTKIVEYEVDDDSDSDSDFDSDSDYEFEDEDEDEEVQTQLVAQEEVYDSEPESDLESEFEEDSFYKHALPVITEEPEPSIHSHTSSIDLHTIPRSFSQDELESKIMNHSLFKPHNLPGLVSSESYSMKRMI